MHLFLAAYRLLLMRLSGAKDLPIGIADTNHASIQGISGISFGNDLLLIRMGPYEPSRNFTGELAAVEEPCDRPCNTPACCKASLDRLGLTPSSPSFPARSFSTSLCSKPPSATDKALGGVGGWNARQRVID
ncbi:beta-ketoacyl synthase domain-containing protein [Colletotrichum tofieldiae]|nr:beta-ketoacyl synthase domain-containing protein [Colletotrichum tofieldiae]GKT74084.1 beta-ketoacyl synthase domain-containing protein [Colletotrichum tofieldiae]GKT96075.1 beta-ketoacyl synthase domain-containing protein [Colletotrichum tofieldiae]